MRPVILGFARMLVLIANGVAGEISAQAPQPPGIDAPHPIYKAEIDAMLDRAEIADHAREAVLARYVMYWNEYMRIIHSHYRRYLDAVASSSSSPGLDPETWRSQERARSLVVNAMMQVETQFIAELKAHLEGGHLADMTGYELARVRSYILFASSSIEHELRECAFDFVGAVGGEDGIPPDDVERIITAHHIRSLALWRALLGLTKELYSSFVEEYGTVTRSLPADDPDALRDARDIAWDRVHGRWAAAIGAIRDENLRTWMELSSVAAETLRPSLLLAFTERSYPELYVFARRLAALERTARTLSDEGQLGKNTAAIMLVVSLRSDELAQAMQSVDKMRRDTPPSRRRVALRPILEHLRVRVEGAEFECAALARAGGGDITVDGFRAARRALETGIKSRGPSARDEPPTGLTAGRRFRLLVARPVDVADLQHLLSADALTAAAQIIEQYARLYERTQEDTINALNQVDARSLALDDYVRRRASIRQSALSRMHELDANLLDELPLAHERAVSMLAIREREQVWGLVPTGASTGVLLGFEWAVDVRKVVESCGLPPDDMQRMAILRDYDGIVGACVAAQRRAILSLYQSYDEYEWEAVNGGETTRDGDRWRRALWSTCEHALRELERANRTVMAVNRSTLSRLVEAEQNSAFGDQLAAEYRSAAYPGLYGRHGTPAKYLRQFLDGPIDEEMHAEIEAFCDSFEALTERIVAAMEDVASVPYDWQRDVPGMCGRRGVITPLVFERNALVMQFERSIRAKGILGVEVHGWIIRDMTHF